MSSYADELNSRISRCVTEIVSAYVSNNLVPPSKLPDLIEAVHSTLVGLTHERTAPAEQETEKPTAAQIRKSITPDALISFIDGKPYQMLKRHLARHGLDPHDYRQRYGLPSDYPITAPSYSERRSQISNQIHARGQKRR